MPSPRFLVLGAGGLVGGALARLLGERGLPHTLRSRSACDITSRDALLRAVDEAHAAVVINCGAYNAVDRAESEPDEAMRINRDGAGLVAEVARQAGALVVHYSSDFVYAGDEEAALAEDHRPAPRSAYARSKLAGDLAVMERNPRHLVLRVGNLYGQGGRNFGSTMLDRLRAAKPGAVALRADGERVVQPTSGGAVAAQTLRLVEVALATGATGLFHAVCHGQTTWADFARALATLAGFDPALVESVPSAALPAPAPRPRHSVLENRALARLGADVMPHWRDALAGYLVERHALAAPPS